MSILTNVIVNNKYQLVKKVGSGSYGIVYSARHLSSNTNKLYAIKLILKDHPSMKKSKHKATKQKDTKHLIERFEQDLHDIALNNNGLISANLLDLDLIKEKGHNCKILKEISIQLKVHKHPNILSIYRVYDNQISLIVVMDYYPEGDLFAAIVTKQLYKNDPKLIKDVFLQLIDALSYCHAQRVYHCDLKPENVLVANNGTKMILADFGLSLTSRFIDSNICLGSSFYMAPERIQNFNNGFDDLHNLTDKHGGIVKFPTSAGDVWSLIVILINFISIRNPWAKASLDDITFKSYLKDYKVLMKILPISKDCCKMLSRYLVLDPWKRGSLLQLRYDFLKLNHLSKEGPLSISCGVDVSESMMCQIPVDHTMSLSDEDIQISQRTSSSSTLKIETEEQDPFLLKSEVSSICGWNLKYPYALYN
ncbi:hypothetical protein LJB42_004277 [Komagataella kurtzmanii]|nr:hypothetical protein LJB42_004277 [Komagataella kurtzmanii]